MSGNGMADVAHLRQEIDHCVDILSEKHRLQRKIRFLLDVRGLLVVNKVPGDYVEWGVYRGEMMYAAAKILCPYVRRFIGFDTFSGLPGPIENDETTYRFESHGDRSSPVEVAQGMLEGVNAVLIRGDFREQTILESFRDQTDRVSVAVIDCNWPSSVKAAFAASLPLLGPGSVVYIDDFFAGTSQPNYNRILIEEANFRRPLRFSEFSTYPPFGRAFVVEPT